MGSIDWYRRTTKDASTNAVALKAGIVQSTLSRQLKAGDLTPESVVAIARAYRVDVLDGLVELGLISADDIRAHGVHVALRGALDIELAAEITRRLPGVLDEPLA